MYLYFFLKSIHLKNVCLFFLLMLLISCAIHPPVIETIRPTSPLVGRTIDLVSVKIKHNQNFEIQDIPSICLGSFFNGKDALEFLIRDYITGYEAEVRQKRYPSDFNKFCWSTEKMQKNKVKLTNLCILVKQISSSIIYPVLIFPGSQPNQMGGYQFKFRKSGSVRIDYKIINSDGQVMYQENNFMPAGDFFDIEWDGRDLNGVGVKKGIYSLFMDVSFGRERPTPRTYNFYHKGF